MTPRLTRNSAGSHEGAEHTKNHEDRHENASDGERDDTFFSEEGGDSEGDKGNRPSDLELEQEKDEATTELNPDKKKVVVDDKNKKTAPKRKPVDPAIKENAHAAVRFDEERCNALCPNEERSRGKSPILRKKSLYHMHSQLKPPDEALADVIAKNADKDEDPELSFDLFTKYISQAVEDTKTFDARITRRDVTVDLKQKMEEVAELFIRDSMPCVPFQTLLPSSNLPFSDYLNEEKFTELCDKDPQAMFREFKLLSIMSMARAEQVSELYRLVSYLNVKLKTIHDWVPALADHYETPADGGTEGLEVFVRKPRQSS